MESLSEKEKQILESLAKYGTMTPSEISVKTFILPDELQSALVALREKGYINKLSVDSAKSLEKEALSLTEKGRRRLKS